LTSIRDSRNTPALLNRRRRDTKPVARESERERKKKTTSTGQPQERKRRRETERKTADVGKHKAKKTRERMKERQRQSKRKEEVLFAVQIPNTFWFSSFSLFFIAFSLSRGAFCVLRFFFLYYIAASSLLFAVCDRTINKKQATGRRKNANRAEAKNRQEKRKG